VKAPSPKPKEDSVEVPFVGDVGVPDNEDLVEGRDTGFDILEAMPPIVWQVVGVLILIWVLRVLGRRLLGGK
jgi:hypothetical protein